MQNNKKTTIIRRKKMKRLITIVLALMMVIGVMACAGVVESGPPPAPAPEPAPAPAPAPAPEDDGIKPMRVGLSNTFMFPWRAQMIDNMLTVFEFYKGRGWVEGELIIQHAGVDTNSQITQIRNMINDGLDIILINPISADALNTVVEEAVDAGITVVAFDQAITARGVYNVTIDHFTWGYQFADWLCKAIGEEGEVAFVEGLPGHPANDDRVRGWEAALEKYPNVTLVGSAVGNWDFPGAQIAASQLMATNPNLAGIISMDGMAIGLFNAIREANKFDSVITTSETQVTVLREWANIREEYPDFESFGIINPPGIGATALGFALRIARGQTFNGELIDGNTYFYNVTGTVDKNNFDEWYERYVVVEGRPDSYYPDEWLTSEQLDAMFD